MPVLARAWQMLLKGLEEVQRAPQALQAAEMVLVRLAYVADLPPPAEVVRALGANAGTAAAAPSPRSAGAAPGPGAPPGASVAVVARGAVVGERGPGVVALAAEPPEIDPCPQSFEDVLALFDRHRESVLRSHLFGSVHLVAFEPGRIELRLDGAAPRDLPNRVSQLLQQWTGRRWALVLSNESGAPSLREQAESRAAAMRSAAAVHPLVRAVLDTFPGARIEEVREIAGVAAEPEESEGAES
jgi:DNA polymerase-3 subunit gamma/tau